MTFGLICSKVLDSLICLEMVFDIEDFSFLINPFVCVRAIAIHVTESIRGTSIRKEDCDLMKCLRAEAPEIPCHVWISRMIVWMFLLTVNEIRELNWVLNEENWSIVSYHVVVSLFSIEFYCKSSRVPCSIGRSFFSSDSGKSLETWCPLSYSIQELCLCEPKTN
jgi:hypothetical protein